MGGEGGRSHWGGCWEKGPHVPVDPAPSELDLWGCAGWKALGSIAAIWGLVIHSIYYSNLALSFEFHSRNQSHLKAAVSVSKSSSILQERRQSAIPTPPGRTRAVQAACRPFLAIRGSWVPRLPFASRPSAAGRGSSRLPGWASPRLPQGGVGLCRPASLLTAFQSRARASSYEMAISSHIKLSPLFISR